MTYTVIILKRAQKEARKISEKDRKRVTKPIESLQTDPFRGKQLQGDFDGVWAIRVWSFRIMYTIKKDIVTVTVLRIGHRKSV